MADVATREKLLSREFYARHPKVVARQLLGKLLVRREGNERLIGRIVETEAYLGADDAAAHAAAGKTMRNAVLFGPPGHAYVYFTYGMYYCLNVSCEPEGKAGCVLIRALEPLEGITRMVENRNLKGEAASHAVARMLCSGPGKLCRALAITRERDNGKDVTDRRSDLMVLDDGVRVRGIKETRRIGITKSPELRLRFVVSGSAYLSR